MSTSATITSPTTKLRNILFATDFSADSMHAVPYVAAMASKLGSSVYLCHVVMPDSLVAIAPEAAPSVYEGMKAQAVAQLTALAHAPELAGFEPKTVVATVKSVFVSPTSEAALSLLPPEILKNRTLFPSEKDIAKFEMLEDLGDGMQVWDRIWTELKAAGD